MFGIFDGLLNFTAQMEQDNTNAWIAAMNNKLAQEQLALAEKEYYSNVGIMNKNFGLQQEAFNYNKAQAALTRQREDNAFQRRVQDYVNSGFSPLAAQGVASSNHAPTLTAPQLDPSGVNQATANRLTAYQNKIASNNQTTQLKLQQQQLKLAQLETVKEMASSIFSIRGQILSNDRLKAETDWYKEKGFRDTTFQTLLSDFINGFSGSFDGNVKDLGKWSGDALQKGWNTMVKKALDLGLGDKDSSNNPVTKFFNNLNNKSDKNDVPQVHNISDKQQKDLFSDLKDARNGLLSPIAIDRLRSKLNKYFDSDMGLPYGRWKSLSQKEYENILKQIQERLRYVR